MPSIYNFTQPGLRDFLSLIGEKPFRAEQIMRWVYHQRVQNFSDMVNIPKSLRSTLSEQLSFTLPTIQQEQVSRCGTTKWLMNLGDDNAFETVFIPENNRGTLCISSQIGCAPRQRLLARYTLPILSFKTDCRKNALSPISYLWVWVSHY